MNGSSAMSDKPAFFLFSVCWSLYCPPWHAVGLLDHVLYRMPWGCSAPSEALLMHVITTQLDCGMCFFDCAANASAQSTHAASGHDGRCASLRSRPCMPALQVWVWTGARVAVLRIWSSPASCAAAAQHVLTGHHQRIMDGWMALMPISVLCCAYEGKEGSSRRAGPWAWAWMHATATWHWLCCSPGHQKASTHAVVRPLLWPASCALSLHLGAGAGDCDYYRMRAYSGPPRTPLPCLLACLWR